MEVWCAGAPSADSFVCRKPSFRLAFILLPSLAPGVVLYSYRTVLVALTDSRILWLTIGMSGLCFLVLLFDCSGVLQLFGWLRVALRDYFGGRGWNWQVGYVREERDNDEWTADMRRVKRRMGVL